MQPGAGNDQPQKMDASAARIPQNIRIVLSIITSTTWMSDCSRMAQPSMRSLNPAGVPARGLARELRRSSPRLRRASARAFHLPMASLVVDFPRIASPAKEWLTSKVPVWSGFDGNSINRIFIHDIVHSDPIKMAAMMATAVTLIGLGGERVWVVVGCTQLSTQHVVGAPPPCAASTAAQGGHARPWLFTSRAMINPITGGHVLAWLSGPKHEDDSLQTLKEDRQTGLAWLAVITAIALWCSAGDVSFK